MKGTGAIACATPGGDTLQPSASAERPRVVVLIPRGEALRNFVYSGMVRELNRSARVSMLSVTQDDSTLGRFRQDVDEVLPLSHEPYHPALQSFLGFIDLAHFRMLDTVVGKENWERRRAERLSGVGARLRRKGVDLIATRLANHRSLRLLTNVGQSIESRAPQTGMFADLLMEKQPALVFNGSHIHSPAAARPLAAARRLGIPRVGFIFSWDNLTSRGRIKEDYDYYLVWNRRMKAELLKYYPHLTEDRIFITGTPQFDFHFKQEMFMSREQICAATGLDSRRPFILYTTGVATHFPEEHRTVEFVANLLRQFPSAPQLLVRTYIKGTSDEMLALAKKNLPGVVFPPVLWKTDALTPMYEDLTVYNSLLRHCSLGINAASTVSLELMIHDKPVINLGFDPPGSSLDAFSRFERHLRLDHYAPVAQSGGVMVARSTDDMAGMIADALSNPERQREARRRFLTEMFGDTLDGRSAARIAECLLSLARKRTTA